VAAASPKLIGRYLGETSDDIEVVADDLPARQRLVSLVVSALRRHAPHGATSLSRTGWPAHPCRPRIRPRIGHGADPVPV